MVGAAVISVIFLTAAAPKVPGDPDRIKRRVFELLKKGEYEAAIREMESGWALTEHPGFLLNIAVAYERWEGHCKESLEAFERFFLECNGCRLESSARRKRADVDAACRVTLDVGSEPPGASVAIDGSVRGKTPLSVRLLPGSYSLVFDLSGHERQTETVTVVKGQNLGVATKLPKRSTGPPPPPPPPAIGSNLSPGPSPIVWVGFGVGAAGLATAIAGTVLTNRALQDERSARQTPLRKEEIEAFQEDAQRYWVIAAAGYGLALGGIVTGLVLLLLPPETTTAVVMPTPTGIVGTF